MRIKFAKNETKSKLTLLVEQRSYSNYINLEALIGCSPLCYSGNSYGFDLRVRQEKRLKDESALKS